MASNAGGYRNLVLGLWERNVKHLLMVTDCGVLSSPTNDEPPRASLIREIHKFLDYHVRCPSFWLLSRNLCFRFQSVNGCKLSYLFNALSHS
jgi:hypothetical protein